MNILVVESSPHKKGSSNLLAEHFIQGAEEKGHKVESFDAAYANIHPCLGLVGCPGHAAGRTIWRGCGSRF